MQRAAEEIKSELGPCGILVNGAGGNNPKAITTNAAFTPEELDSEAFGDKIGFFNVNMDYFRSVYRHQCCRHGDLQPRFRPSDG